MKRYWTCPKGCGGRWERSLVKCRTEGCEGRRPKKRGAAHARTLRDDSYAVYELLNGEIHAAAFDGEWTPDRCGACGKPPTPNRKSDRDHDHTTGRARGLLCGGDTGCNVLLPRWVTAPVARAIADTKLVAGEPDAGRWDGLAAYLERVEVWERFTSRRCRRMSRGEQVAASSLGNEPMPTFGLDRDYPLLMVKAREYDFAERLGGCSDPLMAEIDEAMRELWNARRYASENGETWPTK